MKGKGGPFQEGGPVACRHGAAGLELWLQKRCGLTPDIDIQHNVFILSNNVVFLGGEYPRITGSSINVLREEDTSQVHRSTPG